MRQTLMMAAGGACAFAGAQFVEAQWVSFDNETSTRLVLGGNVGINDSEEKDIDQGDFNKNGWTDLIVVRKRPFSTVGPRQDMLLMNEQGTLVDRTAEYAPEFLTTLTDARDVIVADLDMDGWLDLVIVSTFGIQPQFYRNLGNDAQGNWLGFENVSSDRLPTINVSPLQFCAGWAGDVTGNGWPDLYFSNYNPGGGAVLDVLLVNTGNGFFVDETQARMGNLRRSAFGTAVEFTDLDGDGDLDIVKVSTLFSTSPWNSNGVFLLFNDGNGFFSWNGDNVGGSDPYMFTIGDLNDSGMPDIFVVKDSQDRTYMMTNAVPDTSVSFNSSLVSSPRTTGFGGRVRLADVDNNGILDVGVSPIDVDIANCGFSNDFALLQNDGSGNMSDPWPSFNSQNFHIDPHDFAFIDINNNGCMDIFMGLCTGWRVFMQTGDHCIEGPLGDLNGDGLVDGADLAILLSQWGTDGSADLNDSGDVDGADLAILLANWTG